MEKKIEWYQEVLSLEPGSRVFFPLAKLFVDTGNQEDAVRTLKQGLDRHPDFLEARMLLVQLLSDLEREDEVHDHLERVIEPLRRYPAFWKSWARSLPEDKRDLAVFLMLVSSNLKGEDIRWTDVVFEGISSLSDRLVGAPLPPPCECRDKAAPVRAIAKESSFEESAELGEENGMPAGSLRTRTMADLLASQGDYEGALEIYNELFASADAEEQARLKGRIQELEAHRDDVDDAGEPGDPFSAHAKNRLIGTLEMLASRFEARVRS